MRRLPKERLRRGCAGQRHSKLDSPGFEQAVCSSGQEMHATARLSREASAHRVPNLQLDLLPVNVYHASTELHSNGEVMDRLEALVGELEEEAGLANTCTDPEPLLDQKRKPVRPRTPTCVSYDNVLEEIAAGRAEESNCRWVLSAVSRF